MDWLRATAADLGRGIAAGRIDPVALAEAHLDAIAAHPLRDRIYARVTAGRALAEAHAARDRARAGQRRGLLDGVPLSWKDLYDSAGVATEAGTALMAGRVPATDAAVLATATAMGLVCLGKTHMSEIAFSGLGYNPVTATPPCVNDAGAVPGGSSSGAAASLAFGLAAAAIGSDTGGSIRIPAAWNDLVGFKPAHGRLPLDGVVPLCASFDTVGPLARSVEDAGLVFAALDGARAPDTGDGSLAGARLMVLETEAMEGLEPAPAAGFARALGRLDAAGARITSGKLPCVSEALALSAVLYAPEAYAWWRDRVEAAPHKMYAQILDRIRLGRDVSAADHIAGWDRLRALRRTCLAATAGFDAVIWPTSAVLPPQLDRLISDDAYYKAVNLIALRNTRIGNLLGLTSLSLPTGEPSCGILFNAAPGHEVRLLQLGRAAEAALA
ncbi:MAG: amidase [Rhodobacterales bacterium]|nr:amidase [Rhodobacterales bacterium]